MINCRVCLLLFAVLSFMTDVTFGKHGNKIKVNRNHPNEKMTIGRTKRSINYDNEKIYSPIKEYPKQLINNDAGFNEYDGNEKSIDTKNYENEPPFWGTRGRRSSVEDFIDMEHPPVPVPKHSKQCKHCAKSIYNIRRDDESNSPFWGNRGRRNSDDYEDTSNVFPAALWANKGNKQENSPFWGTRGRRENDIPFWGNRGRRHSSLYSEDRQKYPNPLSWASPRTDKEQDPFWGNRGRRANEPFWGARDGSDDYEPFWGNRGRRNEYEPFWGNRGEKNDFEPFEEHLQKQNLRDSLQATLNSVKHNIENLARSIRSDNMAAVSFWGNKGRDKQLKFLFNGPKVKLENSSKVNKPTMNELITIPSAKTVLNDRIFADEPKFIVLERISRSSSEGDPFYISRGKKKFVKLGFMKSARRRRGSIEELVKSVINDPYYIARGKKDTEDIKVRNATRLSKNIDMAKKLICATTDKLVRKNDFDKREIDDDRDRRTILKKLAAQLQNDPYFVSRGKKNDDIDNEDGIKDFINEIYDKCNE